MRSPRSRQGRGDRTRFSRDTKITKVVVNGGEDVVIGATTVKKFTVSVLHSALTHDVDVR